MRLTTFDMIEVKYTRFRLSILGIIRINSRLILGRSSSFPWYLITNRLRWKFLGLTKRSHWLYLSSTWRGNVNRLSIILIVRITLEVGVICYSCCFWQSTHILLRTSWTPLYGCNIWTYGWTTLSMGYNWSFFVINDLLKPSFAQPYFLSRIILIIPLIIFIFRVFTFVFVRLFPRRLFTFWIFSLLSFS